MKDIIYNATTLPNSCQHNVPLPTTNIVNNTFVLYEQNRIKLSIFLSVFQSEKYFTDLEAFQIVMSACVQKQMEHILGHRILTVHLFMFSVLIFSYSVDTGSCDKMTQ